MVSLHSLLSHRDGPTEAYIFLTAPAPMAEPWAAALRARFPQAQIKLLSLTLPFNGIAACHWTYATYGRLLLHEHFERRVLYLDGDTLICRDIAPLYNADLHGNPIGAVRDFPIERWQAIRTRAFRRRPPSWFAQFARLEALFDVESYVNTGVLLFDFDDPRHAERFRQLGDIEAAIAFSAKHDAPFVDQDWINHLLPGQIELLGPQWNLSWGNPKGTKRPIRRATREIHRAAQADPGIVHYVGPSKPWHDIPVPEHPDRARVFHRYRTALARAAECLGQELLDDLKQ